jgi:hypothetical protein
MSIEEINPTLRKHLIRESTKRMREDPKGIIETLKAATAEEEVAVLCKMLEGYKYASPKTVRKFAKIMRRKRAQFRKNG